MFVEDQLLVPGKFRTSTKLQSSSSDRQMYRDPYLRVPMTGVLVCETRMTIMGCNHTYRHACVCTYIDVHHECVSVCLCVCVCACVHICIYIYIYIYTYTNAWVPVCGHWGSLCKDAIGNQCLSSYMRRGLPVWDFALPWFPCGLCH